MKKEEMNIKIAEACGWKRCRSPMQSRSDPEPKGWQSPKGNVWFTKVPNYCNDLNAMHEAEQTLNDEQLSTYSHKIIRHARHAKNIPDHESHYPVPFVLHATARQRAEALLRTIGQWED